MFAQLLHAPHLEEDPADAVVRPFLGRHHGDGLAEERQRLCVLCGVLHAHQGVPGVPVHLAHYEGRVPPRALVWAEIVVETLDAPPELRQRLGVVAGAGPRPEHDGEFAAGRHVEWVERDGLLGDFDGLAAVAPRERVARVSHQLLHAHQLRARARKRVGEVGGLVRRVERAQQLEPAEARRIVRVVERLHECVACIQYLVAPRECVVCVVRVSHRAREFECLGGGRDNKKETNKIFLELARAII